MESEGRQMKQVLNTVHKKIQIRKWQPVKKGLSGLFCCFLALLSATLSSFFFTLEAEFMNVTISLGILGILRLEVSVYNVYITNQFPTTFAQVRGVGGGGESKKWK